jgi:hypothetical protein
MHRFLAITVVFNRFAYAVCNFVRNATPTLLEMLKQHGKATASLDMYHPQPAGLCRKADWGSSVGSLVRALCKYR